MFMVTIELPIDKVMNWVGGFTDANAALDFIASGGIPVTGIISGGKVTKARLEHVWVEAWVDYIPSRGARHKTGQGDTWVPLDPSYKQFAYTQGIDIKTAVPFDAEGLVNQLKVTATINEQEGFISNVDGALIRTQFDDLKNRIENYVNNNLPNGTIEDLIGKKGIIPQEFSTLPITLPYKTIATGSKFCAIPDSLRHNVVFELDTESLSGPNLSFASSLPELIGKRVTLSYAPATSTDQQTVNMYGGLFNTPAYLINVKSQLRVEAIVKTEGISGGMGIIQHFTIRFVSPGLGSDEVQNNIVAGGYYALGFVPDRLSSHFSSVLRERAQQLENFAKTGGDRLSDAGIGEQLYLSVMCYFFEVDRQIDVVAASQNIVYGKQPGEGIFGLSLNVVTMFGVPRWVNVTGANIDIDRSLYLLSSRTGDSQSLKSFMMTAGIIGSSLEHGVMEQLYRVQGISAAKAVYLANQQGLRIYIVSSANLSAVLPFLEVSDEVKADIINAINAGKEIIIPQREIQVNDWSGAGYVISDPVTGAGAYLISGGIAGGSTTQPLGVNDITNQQEGKGLACAFLIVPALIIAAALLAGIYQFPAIVAAMMTVGLLGYLAIIAILAFILFLVALLLIYIDLCIISLSTAQLDEANRGSSRIAFGQKKLVRWWDLS